MKPLIPQTVLIRKSIKDELPPITDTLVVETTLCDKLIVSFQDNDGVPSFYGDLRGDAANPEAVTHFFDEKQNQYILTKEELFQLLGVCFDAGWDYNRSILNWSFGGVFLPSKETFINNLLNQQ